MRKAREALRKCYERKKVLVSGKGGWSSGYVPKGLYDCIGSGELILEAEGPGGETLDLWEEDYGISWKEPDQ